MGDEDLPRHVRGALAAAWRGFTPTDAEAALIVAAFARVPASERPELAWRGRNASPDFCPTAARWSALADELLAELPAPGPPELPPAPGYAEQSFLRARDRLSICHQAPILYDRAHGMLLCEECGAVLPMGHAIDRRGRRQPRVLLRLDEVADLDLDVPTVQEATTAADAALRSQAATGGAGSAAILRAAGGTVGSLTTREARAAALRAAYEAIGKGKPE